MQPIPVQCAMFPAAIGLAVLLAAPMPSHADAASSDQGTKQSTAGDESRAISFDTVKVGDVEVFYRAAGPADAPVLLLLHGYPSSSHMFRDLIPLLANDYRVIAPDMAGFGATKAPSRADFAYTFDNLAQVTDGFVEAMGIEKFAMYVFDYGAPIGFRLAAAHPERITAIVTQNGNVYDEGLTEGWAPIRRYWNMPTQANRDALKDFQTLGAITWQYTHGVPADRLAMVGLEGPAHDVKTFARAEGSDIQLDLFGDYQTNVALYPEWQTYLREHQPPVLAIWAQNDPFFGPEGAYAFKKDVPDAEIHLLDTGHFALETHASEIAKLMHDYLGRHLNK